MPDRNIGEVMDRLVLVLPEEHHAAATSIINSLRYRAPEQLGQSWDEAQAWLFRITDVPRQPPLVIRTGEEWKAEALAIWAGKTVAEMEHLFKREEPAQ